MALTQKQIARIQFADWLAENHPLIYSQAISEAEAAANNNGLGQWNLFSDTAQETVQPTTETKSLWEKFSDAALSVGTTYLTLKNQRDALELNLERAKAGLPPLDAATTAPVVRTQIGIDPDTASRIASSAGEKMNTGMLALGAIALIAIFMMKK